MEQKWILERLGGHLERLGGVLGRLGGVLGHLGGVLGRLGGVLGSRRSAIRLDGGSTGARRGLGGSSAPAGTRPRRRWEKGREGGTGKKTCVSDLTRRRPVARRISVE